MRPAAAEIPVNPNRPATIEITKKISAHLSMVSPIKFMTGGTCQNGSTWRFSKALSGLDKRSALNRVPWLGVLVGPPSSLVASSSWSSSLRSISDRRTMSVDGV